jgi:ferredoxin-2, mitochondrial
MVRRRVLPIPSLSGAHAVQQHQPQHLERDLYNKIQNNSSSKRWHGGPNVDKNAETIRLSFIQPDDTIKEVDARVGESFLQVAHRNDIDLEGACEGVCACSTCHLIFPADVFDGLEEPSEEEEDMLDMAFGLTETSRLGCQVVVVPEMDGITVEMPKATRNFYVDGHIPKPH